VWPPKGGPPKGGPPKGGPPEGVTDTLVERLQAYMIKSIKEAKFRSSWINPDEGYEDAVRTYVDRVLRGLRPVLRVPGTNLAGVRLARHLGFEAVDLHWLLTRA